MADMSTNSAKILRRLKGLRDTLEPNEVPLLNEPGIWDGGQEEYGRRSMPCDIVITNQRVLGYALTTFPRKRLFLDALPLSTINTVSLRERTHEPIFRELLVSDGQRKVYIRAPRKQILVLYDGLRSAVEKTAAQEEGADEPQTAHQTPIYGKQDIRVPFERSAFTTALLFTGGLLFEILGVVAWVMTQSVQIGLPLCIAGFLAVSIAIGQRRQLRQKH